MGSPDWPTHRATRGDARPTELLYDALGRVISTTLPGGGVIEREDVLWGDQLRQNLLESLVYGSKDGLWHRAHVDRLGRVCRVSRKGAKADEEKQASFADGSALIHQETDGFTTGTGNVPAQTYSYDALGRMLRLVRADGSARTWSYGVDGSRVVTVAIDETGRRRDLLEDVDGQAVKVREYLGQTPVVSVSEYDVAGMTRRLVDPLATRFGCITTGCGGSTMSRIPTRAAPASSATWRTICCGAVLLHEAATCFLVSCLIPPPSSSTTSWRALSKSTPTPAATTPRGRAGAAGLRPRPGPTWVPAYLPICPLRLVLAVIDIAANL